MDKTVASSLGGLLGTSNASQLAKPQIRDTFQYVYPLPLASYSITMAAGIVLNVMLIGAVSSRRLHRDSIYCLIANIAVANLMECIVSLPLTLLAILLSNWVLGLSLCYILPILQDVPLHVCVFSILLVAIERCRFLSQPSRKPLPGRVSCFGTWLTAVCIALPYPMYMRHMDLGDYLVEEFSGVEICVTNLEDDIYDYVRCIFVTMFLIPVGATAYLYYLCDRLLKEQEQPNPKPRPVVVTYCVRGRAGRHKRSASLSSSRYRDGSQQYMPILRVRQVESQRKDFDPVRERRVQAILLKITSCFILCLGPLNILRVLRVHVNETYQNTAYFDCAFALFVWLAAVPTCAVPVLLGVWWLKLEPKDRLRGLFGFSRLDDRQGEQPTKESGGGGDPTPTQSDLELTETSCSVVACDAVCKKRTDSVATASTYMSPAMSARTTRSASSLRKAPRQHDPLQGPHQAPQGQPAERAPHQVPQAPQTPLALVHRPLNLASPMPSPTASSSVVPKSPSSLSSCSSSQMSSSTFSQLDSASVMAAQLRGVEEASVMYEPPASPAPRRPSGRRRYLPDLVQPLDQQSEQSRRFYQSRT